MSTGNKFVKLCNEEARREGLFDLIYRTVFFVEAYSITNGVDARARGSKDRGGAFLSSLHMKLARREWLDNSDTYVGAILDEISDQSLQPWNGRGKEYGDLAGAGFGAIAHELAHSFGLSDDDDRVDTQNRRGSLTGNGWRGMHGYFRPNLTQDYCVLKQYYADLLNSSEFFAIRTLKPKSGDFGNCEKG